VLDKIRSKDSSDTGIIKEKKLRKLLLKAGIHPNDLQKVLKVAIRPSEGTINYLDTLSKWLDS
jgi:hypothetical protein